MISGPIKETGALESLYEQLDSIVSESIFGTHLNAHVVCIQV
jgi:hypothetical protein